MSEPNKVPVLFVDVDGTLRKGRDELGRWVNSPQDVEVYPEVPGVLKAFKDHGWRIIGVTNQGGVALGHLTMEDAGLALLETDRQCGWVLDRVVICIHHPEASDPEMAVCWCRKPRIGGAVQATMLLSAIHRESYPVHLGLMVGDRDEDLGFAENAGLRFMWAKDWRALEGAALEAAVKWRWELH